MVITLKASWLDTSVDKMIELVTSVCVSAWVCESYGVTTATEQDYIQHVEWHLNHFSPRIYTVTSKSLDGNIYKDAPLVPFLKDIQIESCIVRVNNTSKEYYWIR